MENSRIQSLFATLLLCLLLFGCSDPTPVPPDRAEYVGLWVAKDRYISIFGNGRLEYKKKLMLGLHNRVESNFVFEGNKIVSAMFVSFVVEAPPYQEGGQWKMVVDGVAYRHSGAPVTYGKSNHWPKGVH